MDECDFIWKQALYRCNEVKMQALGGPEANRTGVLIRRDGGTQQSTLRLQRQRQEWCSCKPRHTGDAGHHQKLKRCKDGFSPADFRNSTALLPTQVQVLDSNHAKRINACCTHFVGLCYGSLGIGHTVFPGFVKSRHAPAAVLSIPRWFPLPWASGSLHLCATRLVFVSHFHLAGCCVLPVCLPWLPKDWEEYLPTLPPGPWAWRKVPSRPAGKNGDQTSFLGLVRQKGLWLFFQSFHSLLVNMVNVFGSKHVLLCTSFLCPRKPLTKCGLVDLRLFPHTQLKCSEWQPQNSELNTLRIWPWWSSTSPGTVLRTGSPCFPKWMSFFVSSNAIHPPALMAEWKQHVSKICWIAIPRGHGQLLFPGGSPTWSTHPEPDCSKLTQQEALVNYSLIFGTSFASII